MDITVNLASHPFIDLRPILKQLRTLTWALVVVVIVLGASVYLVDKKAAQAKMRVQMLDAEIAGITGEQQSYYARMQRPENVHLLKETVDLNQLFDAKALSWTLVMEDLETVLPAGVQVTGIDPTRAKDGSVTLHIRVRGPRDRGIDLVKNLELSNCFRSPRIVAETADSSTTPGSVTDQAGVPQATEFDVLADYNPDATDHFSAALASAASKESGTSGSQGKAATRASRSTHIGFPKSKPGAATHLGGRQ